MSAVSAIFEHMAERYKPGRIGSPRTYYFSVGDHKVTVRMDRDRCVVEPGNTVGTADCVLKTTPELFERLVLKGERPGAWDIARGRFKTNDVPLLVELRDLFDFRMP